MRGSLVRILLVSTLTLLLALPTPVWAWWDAGHEAVAYVAWRQMTPTARARAITLIRLVPTLHTSTRTIPGYAEWVSELPSGLSTAKQNEYLFMRAATWADSIKHAGLIDSDTPPPGITTDINVGFSDQYSHGYWHFIDLPFSSDGETEPPAPLPNAVTQISALRTAIASDEDDLLKSYDMIFLEHLVGDIHQPLHASDRFNAGAADIGGNLVRVTLPATLQTKYQCAGTGSKVTQLHAFWDGLPGGCDGAAGLPKAVTYAGRFPLLLTNSQLPAASGVADTDPADWANDSLALAEKQTYIAPIGPGITPAGSTAGYPLTSAYYSKSARVARNQIALAGARLAKLLNENLK